MPTIQKIEELEIWQLARSFSKEIFELTQTGKLSKDFSLKDQMNRSSGSIMDNIAEGFGRGSRLEFIQFLTISTGSSDELKSQLYRCLDRNYLTQQEFEDYYKKLQTLHKKMNAFVFYLNKTAVKGQKFKDRLSTHKP
jgi:four helix bundle protein